MSSLSRHFLLPLVATVLLAGAAMAAQPTAPAADDPARQSLDRHCTACHGIDVIDAHADTKDGWNQLVERMVQNGATVTAEERARIVAYLAATHAPS